MSKIDSKEKVSDQDEDNNLQTRVIKEFDYENLYKVKFKKIEKFLKEKNIKIPKDIDDKNKLIDFIKKQKLSEKELNIFLNSLFSKKIENKIWIPLKNKIFLPISNFFKKKKEIKQSHPTNQSSKKDLNKKEKNKKKKKKIGFPSSLVIILSILFLFIIITWIPHDPYVDTSGGTDPFYNLLYNRNSQVIETGVFGLVDAFYAILLGFYQALPLFLYLFSLGALIQIILETGSFERGIGSTLKGLENKKIYSVPIIFCIFSLFGTIWGMQEESIAYYSIIIPFMIISGFTPITSVMILMLANTTGMMSSITNPFASGVAIDSLPSNWDGQITLGTGIASRIVIWVILTTSGAIFVTWYTLKHSQKEDPNNFDFSKNEYIKKLEAEQETDQLRMLEEDFKFQTMKLKDTLSLTAFGITIFLIVIGVFPWQTWFPDFGSGGNGFIDPHIGNFFKAPGEWGFIDLTVILLLGVLVQILIFGPRSNPWSKIIIEGAKGMLGVAIVIGIARAASIVLTYSGMSAVFVTGLSHLPGQDSDYGFLIFMFVSSMVIGTLIPSTSGSAGLLFPLVADLITAAGQTPTTADVNLMSSSIVVFTMCLGITNMFTPAQAVVLASVEKTGLSYGQYIKSVWGFILMQLIIVFFFIIPILSI